MWRTWIWGGLVWFGLVSLVALSLPRQSPPPLGGLRVFFLLRCVECTPAGRVVAGRMLLHAAKQHTAATPPASGHPKGQSTGGRRGRLAQRQQVPACCQKGAQLLQASSARSHSGCGGVAGCVRDVHDCKRFAAVSLPQCCASELGGWPSLVCIIEVRD